MKQVFSNIRLQALALSAIFLVAIAPVSASNGNPEPVELKLVGYVEKQPLFQLYFHDNAETKVHIRISDEFGNTLFSQTVKAGDFRKKFLFNNDEIIDGTVRFEVEDIKTRKTTTFDVNRNSRQVDEIVITPVK